MHREASNCGPTSVKAVDRPGPGIVRVFGGRILRVVTLRPAILLLPPLLFLWGCSSSSPRFTSGSQRGVPADSAAAPAVDGRSGRPETGSIAPGAMESVAGTTARDESNLAIDRPRMLSSIMGMMGEPYAEGGSDSSGIDCSGFTAGVYRDAVGKEIPRSCREQYNAGASVEPGQLRFGDLVFFNIEGRPLSHVGIYVGDGLFAHASVSLGITVSLLSGEYYRRWYAGARRIVR